MNRVPPSAGNSADGSPLHRPLDEWPQLVVDFGLVQGHRSRVAGRAGELQRVLEAVGVTRRRRRLITRQAMQTLLQRLRLVRRELGCLNLPGQREARHAASPHYAYP